MDTNSRLVLLQEKLDNHIEVYEEHRREEQTRWSNLIESQALNTKSIQDLTDSTRDLVTVWQAADGTMKAASAVGKFIKWLSGFAAVGMMINWIIDNSK